MRPLVLLSFISLLRSPCADVLCTPTHLPQTKCDSMIKAFAAGGDFHSRTAMGMYSHVADAVRNGDVLLEVEDAVSGAPKPLLKNVFGSERKKAKVRGLRCV